MHNESVRLLQRLRELPHPRLKRLALSLGGFEQCLNIANVNIPVSDNLLPCRLCVSNEILKLLLCAREFRLALLQAPLCTSNERTKINN